MRKYLHTLPLCSCFAAESELDPSKAATREPASEQVFMPPSPIKFENDASPNVTRLDISPLLELNTGGSLFDFEEIPGQKPTNSKLYRYRRGAEYIGGWVSNLRHGYGELRWSSDSWYKGDWAHGKPCGYGEVQLAPGVGYKGNWCDPNYEGSYKTLTVVNAFDSWLSAVNDGFSKSYTVWLWYKQRRKEMENVRLPSPTTAEEIKSNVTALSSAVSEMTSVIEKAFLREPEAETVGGFVQFRRGLQSYKGCHREKQPEGVGSFSYGPNCVYTGELFNGKPNGFGTHTWPNGKQYSGMWLNGDKHGFGIFSESPSQQTIGFWDSNRLASRLSISESA